MPLDYSKWDALELSDDSDIEVHPNVDKRSFIRAKQSQIHEQRAQRKHQIETLKYERIINDGLAGRISALLNALKERADAAQTRNPAEVAFEALMASYNGDPSQDVPPPRPAGIHSDSEPLPTYSKMMATLLDQVNKALDEKKPENRYQGMVDEIGEHLAKVQGLQKELIKKLGELEKEEGKKITSDSYRTGFDSSYVAKATPEEKKANAGGSGSAPTVELLNPAFKSAPDSSQEPAKPKKSDDDDEIEASPAARKFGEIKAGEYRESAEFLSKNPQILTETETDGLLVLAFDAALEKRDDDARRYVHQALLLQYCRALGRDGVALFFKRVTTKGHQAQDVFYKDVQDTYGRIRSRAAEIRAQREKEEAEGVSQGTEQIQLQAVEPGTTINIRVPPVIPDDIQIEGVEGLEGEEAEKAKAEYIADARRSRAIFEGFSPEMKAALEKGELEEVNKVLGKMKVEDAEELVALFSEAGVLSVEENIIDTTTEDGKKHLEELRETAKQEAKQEAEQEAKQEAKQETTRTEDPE